MDDKNNNDDNNNSLLTRLDSLRRRVAELEARRAGRQTGDDCLYQGDDNYRTLVYNLDVGIYRNTGGPKGRFLRANPAMAKLFRYDSVEDFLDAQVADLYVNPQERELFVEEVVSKGVVRDKELLLRRKDGSHFWGALTTTAQYGANGNLTWIDGIVRDVSEKRKAEEALRHTSEKFSKAFRHVPLAVTISTLDGGRYLEINEATERIFGYSKEEAVGKTAHELGIWVNLSERDKVLEQIKREGSSERNIFKLRAKDGQEKIGLVSVEEMVVDGQRCMLSVMTDITESTRTLEALRESEEKFAKAFRQSPFWVLITSLAEGRFIEMNEAFLRSMGRTREELLGKASVETGVWVYPSQRREFVEAIERSGSVSQKEILVRDREGHILTMLLSGEEIVLGGERCIVSVAVDITERKEAERALRESEEKYRTLTQNMHDVVFLVQDGVIRHINDRVVDMAGYAAQELIGSDFLNFIAPEYRETLADMHSRRLAGEDVSSQYEIEIIARDGKRVMVNSFVSVISYEGGPAVMGTFKDITEIKEAEKEKVKLQSQLQHSQKMEAIGTLASGIAHDFNNILQGIRGYVQLLELHAGQPEQIRGHAGSIDSAVGRATELIHRMLAFGRKLEPELVPVNLNTSVSEAVGILERTIPKMITIELDLAPDLMPASGDANQLEQVILNLANNAADAMPQGGKLFIKTENVSLDRVYCKQHLGATPGDYVCLSITDTGYGMDSQILSRVFDPFYTTKEVGKGTGLGLSIVYGIIKGHGGHLSCYSEPGLGTTFNIYLPVSLEALVAPQREKEDPDIILGGAETILVVDDEEVIAEVAQEALSFYGYKVLTANSGEEALQVHAEKGAEIDLVVLDIGMPGMGGVRCLQELKKRQPDIKVLVASGYSLNGRLKDIKKQGASNFVTKPYRTQELVATIREILDS